MVTFSNKQKVAVAACLLLFALIKLASLWWWQQKQNHQAQTTVQTSCDVLTQGCVFLGKAQFRLENVASNKTPFNVVVRDVPANVQNISVSFAMSDMDMGFNRIDLTMQKTGEWRADNVYLPLCTASRNDWQVMWTVDGQRFEATFHTHQ